MHYGINALHDTSYSAPRGSILFRHSDEACLPLIKLTLCLLYLENLLYFSVNRQPPVLILFFRSAIA